MILTEKLTFPQGHHPITCLVYSDTQLNGTATTTNAEVHRDSCAKLKPCKLQTRTSSNSEPWAMFLPVSQDPTTSTQDSYQFLLAYMPA